MILFGDQEKIEQKRRVDRGKLNFHFHCGCREDDKY